MARTLTQFPAGQLQYRVNFDYLARQFVVLTLLNTADATLNKRLVAGNDYRFLSPTVVEVIAPQDGYDIMQISRETSSVPLVSFKDGSVLTASDLTVSELQAIHIAEEGRDQTVELAKTYADSALISRNEADEILQQIKDVGAFGYTPVGSFELGANVELFSQSVQYGSGAPVTFWRWDGVLPKVVEPNSTPESSGGIGEGKWIDVTDSTLRGQLAGPDGYTLIPSIQTQRWRDAGDIRGWGCKCDGVTDDTSNFQNAINDNKLTGKPCRVPEGVTLVGKLTVYSKTTIQGVGQERSFLKLKAGTNAPCIYSEGADELWGTQSLGGVDGTTIKDLTIDANKASNVNGSGIALYGYRIRVEGVNIINSGRNGMRTEWADSGNASGGMEGSFKNILIDKSGEDGWRFAGPHDSVCSDIIIISSGQKAASTYSGLWLERGNARWSGVHCWTSANDARSKYALKVSRAAEGNEFDTSHFEGADTNVLVEANNFTLSETCKVYYPWDGVNIALLGSNPRISCYVGEEYKGIGLKPANAITFGGGYGGVSGAIIDIVANGMDDTVVYFGASAGYNYVRVRGYNENVAYAIVGGTPHPTDELDIVISGAKSTIIKKAPAAVRAPVAHVDASGGGQAGANGFDTFAGLVSINTGGAGQGIRLPSTIEVMDGHTVKVFNATSSAINIFPYPGHTISGLATDQPITIALGQTIEFSVISASQGQWVAFKGQ